MDREKKREREKSNRFDAKQRFRDKNDVAPVEIQGMGFLRGRVTSKRTGG